MNTWYESTYHAYTSKLPIWITDQDWTKGVHHDKQSLGVILEAGTNIRIRHQSTPGVESLLLELLNDDRFKEKYLPFTDQVTEYTVEHTSALFIRTHYGDTPSGIDITVEYSQLPLTLPIYQANTDADAATFFKQWEDNNSAFALITTQYADILIPLKDKPHLKQLHQDQGLTKLTDYYQGIFKLFNTLAGLSFSPDKPTDKNSSNRYFLKADKNGPGAAYYGKNHTAETNDSTAAFWLSPCPKNWGSIHEIAHGYDQFFFMHDNEFSLAEIWNNIYAHFYQVEHLGDDIFTSGWLYNGQQEVLYDQMEQLFEENAPIGSWAGHQILFYLVLIIYKAGQATLTDFNKTYRALNNDIDFKPQNPSFIDVLSSCCEKTGHIDISPFLRFGHATPSRIKSALSRYCNQRPAYPLYKLIQKEKIDEIQKQLSLTSRLDLVDTLALKKTGLTGTIKFLFEEELFEVFSNNDLLLKYGSNPSIPIKISSKQITIPEIPIGIYTLLPPSDSSGKLHITTQHIEVKPEASNTVKLEYENFSGIKLASQKIHLCGLYGQFATIDIDTSKYLVTFNISGDAPHPWRTGTYTSLIIKDARTRIIFQKDINGDNTIPSTDKVQVGTEYVLELFHAESLFRPNKIIPESNSVLKWRYNFCALTITPHGLDNREFQTQTDENLISTINYMANIIRSQPHWLLHRNHSPKNEIYAAINSFDGKVRNQLLEKHKDIYLTHQNTEPKIITGSSFSWHQSAPGGDIAKIDIDLKSETISIEVSQTIPCIDSPGTYLAIWVHNNTDNILFCQEFNGDIVTEPTTVSLPFKQNYEISVFHSESTRSPITNMETGEQYQVMQRHCVRALTVNSLQI